jgi:hypothetical protein
MTAFFHPSASKTLGTMSSISGLSAAQTATLAASATISDGLPSSSSVWSSAKLSAELDLLKAGISYKEACITRTIVPLLSCTYVSGLPGTITGLGDGALGGIGGVSTLVVGDRLLIKNQYEPRQNGIYDITDLGEQFVGAYAEPRQRRQPLL